MPDDYENEHAAVLQESQNIFEKRGMVRGQMWLETSIKREFDMMDEKLARAKAAMKADSFVSEDPDDPVRKEFEDSLLDLINFAAFAVKKRRRGFVA
jgi:hypothetical protein